MSTESVNNNKRIAKNTLLLYFRMLFLMAIQLYTSRVVLITLGVEDYGIYNVVGGVVAMFSFLNSAMTASTQRYLTFELGKGNLEKLCKVFSTSLNIHILISVTVIILSETVGLWFLSEKLVIPPDRMSSALIVFQLSVLTTVIAILSYPFNADIIAHEKMSAFAYISILEASCKLGVVFLLVWGEYDKLIFYAFLLTIVQLLICICYIIYCLHNFAETRFHFYYDKNMFCEMIGFAGWNLWGNIAAILMGQGLNLLLNVFFGPAVNAARAISVQVQNAIHQFSSNFQMALNPQITKTYATGKFEEMHKLVFRSSKITFLVLFIICLPVLVETPFILKLWLRTVPDNTVVFLRIMILSMIIDSMSNPFMISAAATGKVKKYQSIIGGIILFILPVSYLVLKCGGKPWSVFVVHFCMCSIAFVVRLMIIRPMIHINIKDYFSNVISRCAVVFILSIIIPFLLYISLSDGIVNAVCIILVSVLCALLASFFIGLDMHERKVIYQKLKGIKIKICNC